MMLPSNTLAVMWVFWHIGLIGLVGFPTSLHTPSDTMGASLRIFDAADDDSPLTMRQAYGDFLYPSLLGRSAKTLSGYETVIGHWEAFVAARRITNSNPALPEAIASCPVDQVSQITDSMLNEFGRWLMADIPAGGGLKRTSAETYAKKVRAILRKLGRREVGNPRGVGILESVPAMAPVSDLSEATDDEDGVDLCDEDISRIYEACDVARWPDGAPSLQWKTYVVILTMIGPRVDDAARLNVSHFQLEAKSPAKHSRREHEHGWFVHRQTKTGKRCIVPLPAVVRSHVDALQSLRFDRPLFGWRNADQRPFRNEWNRIVSQAGLPHVLRQHFRGTANLRWSIAANDRDVGRMVLGHAAADVNSKHYTRNEAVLLAHVNNVASPAAFQTDPARGPKQMFLF